MKPATSRTATGIILAIGSLFGLWAAAAMFAGLYQAGSVTELARQYMSATGMIKPLHTMVDFYSHIKGVEYLICVAFFVVFPVFFRYVDREKKQVRISS